MKRRLKIILIIIIILSIIIIGFLHNQYNKTFVTIQNNSEEKITNVKVFIGHDEILARKGLIENGEMAGVILIGEMNGGYRKTVRVYPQSESTIKMSHEDLLGNRYISNEVYVEAKNGYRLLFVVTPLHQIKTKTKFYLGAE